MWDLLEGGHLFFAKKNGILDDEQHLAEMVSLLGPPPLEFLKRSEKCYQYWDSQGTTPKSLFFNSKKLVLFCLGHFAIIILLMSLYGAGKVPFRLLINLSKSVSSGLMGKTGLFSYSSCAECYAGCQRRGPLRRSWLLMSF